MSKTMQRILWGGVTVGLLLTLVICGLAFGKGSSFSGGSRPSYSAPKPAPAVAPRPVASRPVIRRPIARPRPGAIRRPTRPMVRRPMRRGVRPVHGPGGQVISYNTGRSHHKSVLTTVLIVIAALVVIGLLIGVAIIFFGYGQVKKRTRNA